MNISCVTRCHLLRQMSFQWGSQKVLQGLVSHKLKACLSVFDLFFNSCYGHNFKSLTAQKLDFINIRGLRLNFVWCESFLESNSPDILALCETDLHDSIDSGNFSDRVYHPLTRKDSITHMYGLAVYVKDGLRFVRDFSRENSADSFLCFRLALLLSVSSFSLFDHLFCLT